MENDIERFLNDLGSEAQKLGINLNLFSIDHVAFSSSSSQEYEKLKPDFLKKGELVREAIISGRRVAIIKFSAPINLNGQVVKSAELIEPIKGEKPLSGWEHAEFLIEDFDDIIKKFPKLNWITKDKDREEYARIKILLPSGKEIKFLKKPLLEETLNAK